ncbi:hypothetical protein [Mycobacterium branderi]|uniref:Uncharacterized protein n=1 Tax=Mycobacterium branderi TaxID=43348 RepID=A0A7I7WC98_9MYCO|nr:hypothetical protein [Mycobacterium branderi]MCV7236225.1 hypothetical protein [Mycobacterium branderi]ORA35412.1 hypothetical protein BST20_17580 [Mycobacterium branderi]BBZ15104.1 hypothetical protein MBRA_52990 [Mycobacterium branderi]
MILRHGSVNALSKVGTLLLALQLIAGCADIGKQSLKVIPPAEAVKKIDAQTKGFSIPSSFLPIKACELHTALGSANISISGAFKAPTRDVNTYVAQAHAQGGVPFFRPAGCPPPPPSQQGPVADLSPSFVEMWYDSGVFAQCTTLEYLEIPSSELRSERASGGVYRQVGSGAKNDDESTGFVVQFVIP